MPRREWISTPRHVNDAVLTGLILILGGCGSADSQPTSPTCGAYCTESLATCTGDNQQYSSQAACLSACSALPTGMAGDTTGDSLTCRMYHLGEIETSQDATAHCSHTGPGGEALCGENCEGYCDIVQSYCTAEARVYQDRADCLTTCQAVPDDVAYRTGVQSGPHVACLLFHAQRTTTDGTEVCLTDLAKTSPTCQ
jgi:hypothetical protein